MSFDGKTAIVTGAASGIGAEIARQMTEAGAMVLATDLASTGIEATGGRALDVTDSAQLQAAVDEVVTEHGHLDYMFNNAGVAIFGEVESVTLEDWDRVIDVNLRGVAHGTTIAYRQMVKQGSGQIINTASVAGLVPVPLQAHYCATKHGVIGLSKTLAVEARKRGVGVTVFCPGFVQTGMIENNTLRGSLEGSEPLALVPVRPLGADKAVETLLKGVRKRKQIVITPFYGRVGWWIERLSLPIANRIHAMTLRDLNKKSA